jgi:hypothetical protein
LTVSTGTVFSTRGRAASATAPVEAPPFPGICSIWFGRVVSSTSVTGNSLRAGLGGGSSSSSYSPSSKRSPSFRSSRVPGAWRLPLMKTGLTLEITVSW